MIDIFSSRELATGIWALIIIVLIFVSKKIRGSAFNVLKTALSKHLLIPFVCMVLYASCFTVLFTMFSLWEWIYLKDIIIWVLFAGVPTCFSAISRDNHEGFYRDIILDNIKFSAFVELIISTFVFHIVAELVLIPIFTILFIFQAVAGMKEEHKPVQKLFSAIIIIATITVLVFTAKEAVASYREIGIVDSIVSFCIPIAFSLFFLPFAYIFSIIAKYQVLFIRMSFKEPESKKIQWKHKRKVFRACGLSYKKVLQFEQVCLGQMYRSMGEETFINMIHSFKKMKGGGES